MKKIGLLMLSLLAVPFLANCNQPNYFTITWEDDDGTILEVDEHVKRGEMPSFDGVTPSKEIDGNYYYTFEGWTPKLEEVKKNQTYTATYKKVDIRGVAAYVKIVIPEDARDYVFELQYESDTTAVIDWGDGSNTDGLTYHKYPAPGEYDIRIKNINSLTISTCSGNDDKYPFNDFARDIYLNEDITSLPYGAFSNCKFLTSINIPNSITELREFCYCCTSLTSITIPASVTSIDDYSIPFRGCSSLISISVDQNNEYFDSRDNCNAIITKKDLTEYPYTKANTLIVGCGATVIPSTVTSIGHFAFQDCPSLISVTLPETLEKIPSFAFENCSSLASIEIPDTVNEIGNGAFSGCSSLSSIHIPSGVAMINKYSFEKCSSLTSITVDPGNETYEDKNANAIITKVDQPDELIEANTMMVGTSVVPEGVVKIGDEAFYGRASTTSIEISSTVTTIAEDAFVGCSSLTSITVNSGNEVYEDRDANAIITKKQVGTTPANALLLGTNNIPEGVTSIEPYAFSSRPSLTSIEIPNTVTTINGHAFDDCDALTSIYIPSSVNNIDTLYGSIVNNCSSLASITVDPSNENYEDRNANAIITKSANEIITICKATTIPDSVTSVGRFAISRCPGLTSIVFPNSVINFGDGEFGDCPDLSLIDFSAYTIVPNKGYGFINRCAKDLRIKVANETMANAFVNSHYNWPKDINFYIW